MKGYTLDTNVVAAHLKTNAVVTQRMRHAEAAGYPVMLNAVSYYETRRGLLFAGARTQLAAFEQLWRTQGILMIDQVVLDKAADIYADLRAIGQLIEDADLLPNRRIDLPKRPSYLIKSCQEPFLKRGYGAGSLCLTAARGPERGQTPAWRGDFEFSVADLQKEVPIIITFRFSYVLRK